MLGYNTQETSYHAVCLVSCPIHWESTTLVYFAIYSCCSQWFCAIVAKHVLASITSSKLCGWSFICTQVQLSHVHLTSTLDVMHVIKCTRLSPSLAGRAWELSRCNWISTVQVLVMESLSALLDRKVSILESQSSLRVYAAAQWHLVLFLMYRNVVLWCA